MKRFLRLLALSGAVCLGCLVLTGCGDLVRIDPPKPEPKTLEEAVQQTADANKKADDAIKTSADATKAAQGARAEAAAARQLADKYDGEAKKYEAEAIALHRAETARAIAVASWWTFGAGILAALIGVFLVLRFPGKTSVAILIGGASVAALGLIGVWLAPVWMTVAWIAGAAMLIALAGGLTWLLHGHQTAVRDVWNLSEEEIRKSPRLVRLLTRAGAKV